MKKLLLSMICLFTVLTSQASQDDDRPIQINQLPKVAQEFIQKNFSGVKVALAKMEADFFDKSYEVIFTNGNKVEFDSSGRWKEVECKYTEVPASVVPVPIKKYVEQNYPEQKIWKLEYGDKRKSYEVKLSNRWELKFDMKGNLIDLDRD